MPLSFRLGPGRAGSALDTQTAATLWHRPHIPLSRPWRPTTSRRAAAELGALAWKIADERWSDTTNDEELSELARRTLTEVRAASALC
jgi:hypothetical protein